MAGRKCFVSIFLYLCRAWRLAYVLFVVAPPQLLIYYY